MFKIFHFILNPEFQPLQPLMKSFFAVFFGDGFEILDYWKPSVMGHSIIVKNSQAFTYGKWAPFFIRTRVSPKVLSYNSSTQRTV